jgi:hypothetical protein
MQTTKRTLTTRDIPGALQEVFARTDIDNELRSRLLSSDVILLPLPSSEKGFAFAREIVFSSETIELFHHLKAALESSTVEIATRDESYQERLLHGVLLDLGVLFATYAAVPMLPNALWDYVKKRTGILMDAADTKVRLRLMIAQRPDGESATEVTYEGSAADFKETIGPALQELARAQRQHSASRAGIQTTRHK